MRTRSLLASLALLLLSSNARAADFYVDPVSGSMSNDGSAAKPWSTLAEVVAAKLIESQGWESLPYAEGKALVVKNAGAPVKAGDTIHLRTGYHGDVELQGYYNAQDITVAAAPGQQPTLGHLNVTAGQRWRFVGLSLSASFAPTYVPTTAMVALANHNFHGPVSDITVEDCSIESVPDTSKWSGDDWLTLPADGISAQGKHHVIRNNKLHNVRFGISVSASDSLVERNVIDSFGNGDGLRGLGDNSVFQYNVVKNAHHPDPNGSNGNHDDGFQSWSVGVDPKDGKSKPGFGVVKGIVLRGNLIINKEDPAQPFPSGTQGIGCFDGMYEDFVIENNVIISDTYHGIALYGAINSRIVNNTVIDRTNGDKTVPWIMIHDHKDGTPSTGNVVRNNLTTAMKIESAGVVQDHNSVIKFGDYGSFFVNAPSFDLRLLPGAPAVDQGVSELAPALDADGVPRPQGAAVDLGAYEWHDGSVAGSGGSGGTGGSGGSGGSDAGAGGAVAGQGGSGGSGQSGAGGSGGSGGAGGAGGSGQAGGGGSGQAGGGGSGQAGGAGGSGGSGQAGSGAASSGAAGSGVAGSGTAGGAGGAAGAGQAGGGAAGGAAGKGGAGQSGASGQSGGGQSGSAGAGAASGGASEDDGGCGCRAAGRSEPAGGVVGLLVAALAMGRRRRR